MKSVFVALFAIVSVASAQKFFFSDAPTAPAGVPIAPAVSGAPLVPGVPGGPLVPGLPGFVLNAPAPPPPAPVQFAPVQIPALNSFQSAPASASFQSAPAQFAFQQPQQQKYIPIVEHTQTKNADGSYNLRYETANGIAQQEQSQIALNAKGEQVVYKSGSYGYTAPDGTPVSISYTADANGFRVSGNPLPVAPQPLSVPAPAQAFF